MFMMMMMMMTVFNEKFPELNRSISLSKVRKTSRKWEQREIMSLNIYHSATSYFYVLVKLN